MKVLIIGSGGREHAILWKIKQSKYVSKIYAIPGNAGMNDICECVDILPSDVNAVLRFAEENNIDLTIVGPEAPLVNGISDAFKDKKRLLFGPSQEASKLEGSKDFCRQICKEANVKIADGLTFKDSESALKYIKNKKFPIVIKADGLAAGKGVYITSSYEESESVIKEIMIEKKYGKSGDKIIIEEFLRGYEVSILAVCSPFDAVLLEPSMDHKRIYDHDKGPNTGGMGAFSPVPFFTNNQKEWTKKNIILPVLKVMREKNIPFSGILYAGLMVNGDTDIKVLEFNVRFGDPETEAVLPRLKSDLFELLYKAAKGENLNDIELEWSKESCVTVVAASKGYPDSYEKGCFITGLDSVKNDSIIFHAGTKKKDGQIVTNGGRVLMVSSLGVDMKSAKAKCYETLKKINFNGIYYRTDISDKAWKDLGEIN